MLLKNKKYYIFTNPKGERYAPVTKTIAKFKPEQDWIEICRKTAEKRGVDPITLRAEWDANAEKSKKKGIIYHELMEEHYRGLNKPNVYFTPKDLYVYQDCLLKDNSAYIEKILWDDENKIFGIADFIQIKNGMVNIIDYKTNAKIDFEAFGDRKMLPPIQHLPDSNYYEYGLETSFFMWLALKANPGLIAGDMLLEHITFADDGITVLEKSKIPVMYYHAEVEDIIKSLK